MERPGKIIRARREALAMSQEQLAWLSRVSRTTIRNIEADRVEEARTWDQVERALGWQPGSLDVIRSGRQPANILPVGALSLIIKAVIRSLEASEGFQHDEMSAAAECKRLRSEAAFMDENYERFKRLDVPEETKEDLKLGSRQAHIELELAERELANATERVHAFNGDLNQFRLTYETVTGKLSTETNAPLEQRALWIKSLLDIVLQYLSPGEADNLYFSLRRTVGAGAFRASTEGKGQIGRPSNQAKRVYQPQKATRTNQHKKDSGSFDRLMTVTIRVPKNDFDELDQEDVVWVAEKLSEIGVAFVEVIAQTKKRGRGGRDFETIDEFPDINISDTDKG